MKTVCRQMSNQQLRDFLQAGGALVDVRREEEWRQTGVVEGSILLPFFAVDGSSNPGAWREQLNLLVAEDKPVALICRSGYRTSLICEYLVAVGQRPEVFNVTAGILGWLAAMLPVSAIED